MGNGRFDKEAAEWDTNPFTVRSSKLALGALLENVPGLKRVDDRDQNSGMPNFLLSPV
jgi:hypothetical protein